jgi:hyperosmotically inducible periplasmic protein
MERVRYRLITLSSSLMLATAILALPSPHPRTQEQSTPDNTIANKDTANRGSANSDAQTADGQKMDPADTDLTKKIRSAIYQDKSLSTYAHNIKIITHNGAVTLKGPVRSEDEKANIEAKAAAIAGEGNMHSKLTVAPLKP